MAISRSRLEEYQDALEAISQEAQDEWARFRDAVSERSFEPEIVRDAAIDKIRGISAKYGDMSAALAAELFEDLGEAEAGEAFDALLSETYDQGKLEGSVRYAAHHLFDNSEAAFFDYLLGTVDKAVKQPARDTIMDNAARHRDSGVRYARIPRGPTCPFCIMLASRGFVYHTPQSAGEMRKFHPKCDCQIVPSWEESPRVAGYDPEGMYDRYLLCRDTVERVPGTASTEEILEEMRTRGRRWLYDGTPCQVTKERGAKPNEDERAVAGILARSGFEVAFVAESKEKYVKSPDAKLNGVLWEFKIPTAFNEKTVKNQFKKSLGKGTPYLLISNCANGADGAAMIDGMRRILESGEFAEITEVLFVGVDGTLVRIKR